MKKLYYLIVLALILGLVLTGCLLSNVGQVPTTEQSGITYLTKHTEGDPFTTVLIADGGDETSAIDVGEILVWNDGNTLYVQYVVTAPWCLTETHLHVFLDDVEYTDVPQKNGNPPPGQFDYKEEHECVPDYTYEIPLDWIPETPLFIAAHAVVCKLSEVMPFTLVSDTGTKCAGFTNTDPSVDPLDPFNYGGETWNPAVDLSSPHSSWYKENNSPFSGAFWISGEDPREGSGLDSQWRLFKEDFTIPPGAVNIAGSLYMTADNAVEAYLNGISVGSTTYVYGSQPDPIEFPVHYYFKFAWGPYNLALQADSNNALEFVVRNWAGSATSNPTGLLYKMNYEYQLLECETAWAAGFDFPGKNWATYFTYEIQWNLLETITVPAEGGKITSINTLEDDQLYKFEASGMCNWRVPPSSSGYLGDAEYWLRNDAHGVGWTHMGIWSLAMWDGAPVEVEWGSYNDAHIYTVMYTPSADGVVTFFFNDDAYGDNSGFLTVKIYEQK